MRARSLVPKKGLEPPHPCGYMDLNHARLPIPPLRRGKRTRARDATHSVGNSTIVQAAPAVRNVRGRSVVSQFERIIRTIEPTQMSDPATNIATRPGFETGLARERE
jgi:hypothetical protein